MSEAAVVLLSGGLDSSVLLHYAARDLGRAPIHALSYNYGQRHSRELECARWQAEAAGVASHRVIDISFLGELLKGGSTLLEGGQDVPDLADLSPEELTQPPTYVPNRNMMLLSMAAAYAEVRGVRDVFYGAQAQDEYGYWDCTRDFLERVNAVLALNRRERVQIHAPFVGLPKAETVRRGIALGVDFAHTWSCYRGAEEPCGTCPTCVERGDPSHHNYSDAIHGLGQFYDLAAQGEKKDRCREAIDALVSYWVDNDLLIRNYEDKGTPVPILGLTDGRTLNTRVMMAIAGAKVTHHATGNEKFQKVYDQLCAQYNVRGLQEFRAEKGFDDAEHVFCHLENLFRLETDPELLAGFRKVLDGLWANHKDDGQSLFTYIYVGLTPDAPDRDKALKEALFTLQTWPTDMTLRPRMNSLYKDRKPPYPTYQAAWDNEYIWKGSLLQADGWLARTITGVAVPAEDPVVIYAFDEEGGLYQSRDGAATEAGWRPIDQELRSPVRALDAGQKIRILAVACDDGFRLSTTAGYEWETLPVPADGGKPADIRFHPENPNVLFAVTSKNVYRSRDFGEKFLGQSWECLTGDLPPAGQVSFTLALGPEHPGRIYAILDGQLFTRRLDEAAWQTGEALGLREYAKRAPWLAVDPSNPDHAFAGHQVSYGVLGTNSLLQETRDGGLTWTHGIREVYERYAKGGMKAVLEMLIPDAIVCPAVDPRNPQDIFTGGKTGILKSSDGGQTWQEKKAGLDIPVARSVFAPRHSEWIFAGTPAGLFVSKDRGETWEDAHLCLQWQKNTKRELGGAEFIDAYWRARYYGFIDDATAKAPYAETPQS